MILRDWGAPLNQQKLPLEASVERLRAKKVTQDGLSGDSRRPGRLRALSEVYQKQVGTYIRGSRYRRLKLSQFVSIMFFFCIIVLSICLDLSQLISLIFFIRIIIPVLAAVAGDREVGGRGAKQSCPLVVIMRADVLWGQFEPVLAREREAQKMRTDLFTCFA